MHPFLESLQDWEAMLLLTTLTVGGSDDVGIFKHTRPEVRARLEQKAQSLLAIPPEKRVSFMVHEIKQALSLRGLRGVERVDPSWILHRLKGERASVVATVLVSLPGPTVRSVLERLPPGIRKKLPPRNQVTSTRPDLVRAVRQIFEARFARMPAPSPKGFAFRDVIQLERTEIRRLIRDLGLVELGQAFAAVGKMALTELCRRLPRDKAEELILAVKSASRVDMPDIKSAQRFLSRVVTGFADTEEFFQKSGLWRLAKASLAEDGSVRHGFTQRLPRPAGKLYETYLETASEMAGLDAQVLGRLQDSILLRVKELSMRGVISGRWANMEFLLHNAPIPPEATTGRTVDQRVNAASASLAGKARDDE